VCRIVVELPLRRSVVVRSLPGGGSVRCPAATAALKAPGNCGAGRSGRMTRTWTVLLVEAACAGEREPRQQVTARSPTTVDHRAT